MATIKPNKKGVVTGTKGADKITWLSTKDWAKALTVNAGAGNDKLDFRKSKYKNKLNGDAGNDTIWGGTNADSINGGAGNDQLFGYNGNDVIYAGAGNDVVKGGNGNDKIYGQAGTNQLYGEAGNDNITGGTGNDKIWGGKGNDVINAGKGTNTIIFNKGDGTDTVLSGGGTDTLQFTSYANINALKAYLSPIKNGNNLELWHGAGDKVTIRNFFASNTTFTSSVKKFMAKSGAIAVDTLLNGKTFWFGGSGKISGTKYKDNIGGSDGNDTISAGAGNDTINGGMGNDVINAGAGSNLIVMGYDAGDDIIISGGGKDTISFESGVSLEDLDATIADNGKDLIISDGTSSATLQNYMSGGHSVVKVQTPWDDAVSVSAIKHHINSTEKIVNGTSWGDDIKTSFAAHPIINAGAGDDIIRITNDSAKFTEVNIGTGNDTISYEADDANFHDVDIYFSKGKGNNTITGLTDDIYTQGTGIYLNSPDLIRTVSDIKYIAGNINDDGDLVLKLDGGETFTIEGYDNMSAGAQNNIQAFLNSEDDKYNYSYYNSLNSLVYSEDDIIQTDSIEAMPVLNDDHKLMIVQKNGVNPTLNGSYNTYAQEGSGTQYTNIYGHDNRVYLTNNGTAGYSTDRTTVDVYGNNNAITVKGNGFNSVNMTATDGLTGNIIAFCHGNSGKNNNYVWTSVGGETEVHTYTTDNLYGEAAENAECSVCSYGTDTISLVYGTNDVDFLRMGEETKSDKTVKAYYETHNKILNATEANSINITNKINDAGSRETTDVMFEHYTSNRSVDDDYISLAAKDSNGNIYTTADLDIDICGSWETGTFDLDTAAFANSVSVSVGLDSFACTKKLSEMSQLIDMNKTANNYTIDSGILTIANGVAVQGTESADTYTVSNIAALTKQYTITEKGGSDTISIAGSNNFRLFFDVNTDGNFGNDLYIFQTAGLDAGDYGSEFERFIKQGTFKENEGDAYRDANGICIKNANLLASANVERIVSAGTSKYIGTTGYINAIKENIATWLNNYNADNGTSYGTVMEAIQDGAGNYSLFAAYTSNANDTWTANLYNVG